MTIRQLIDQARDSNGYVRRSVVEIDIREVVVACNDAHDEELATVVAWLRSLSPVGHRSIHDDIADALQRREHLRDTSNKVALSLVRAEPVGDLPKRSEIKWVPGRHYAIQLDEHYDRLHDAYEGAAGRLASIRKYVHDALDTSQRSKEVSRVLERVWALLEGEP